MSAYERGPEVPDGQVVERVIEAACYELALAIKVRFERGFFSRGVHPFWVPDRLWRGRLPECFCQGPPRRRHTLPWRTSLRPAQATSTQALYELLPRRGQPEELIDCIDVALLVDLLG